MNAAILIPERVPDLTAAAQLVAPGAGAGVTLIAKVQNPSMTPGKYLVRFRLSNSAGEANIMGCVTGMTADILGGVPIRTVALPSAEEFIFSTVTQADLDANHAWEVTVINAGGALVPYQGSVDAWLLSL